MSVSTQLCQAASQAFVTSNPDTCPRALKWSFRLMVELQGYRKLLPRHGIEDDEVARSLGLEKWVEAETYNRLRAIQQLKRNAWKFDGVSHRIDYPEPLNGNLQALARMIGLSELERHILGFCALMHSDPLLNRTVSVFGGIGSRRLAQVLASLLEFPLEGVQRALSREGQLVASGLLQIRYDASSCDLEQILDFNSRDLMNQLCFHRGTVEELFQHSFRSSDPAMLTPADYQHLQQPLEMAVRYLDKSLNQRRPGVNILIYGPPGTGKTELCRMLALELRQQLYEVACSDSDGDPIGGHQRLCALRSAMHVFQGNPVLMMLDEIEDIFMDSGGRGRHNYKGWINRMLEENSQPCFWLSNDISQLDPAYVRRFDLVIEMPNPSREQRARIIRKLAGERLDDAQVERLASNEDMTPAVFERAYHVARTVQPRSGHKQNQTLEYLLDATLKAQGHEPLSQAKGSNLPGVYSPQLINTDIALDDLLAGLRRCPQARLCFYGPPGTGKTAFANWLAQSLDKPLHVKRVSDLLGSLVGETEQNLAAAFRQAESDGAVLLLDEVDSFLQDRRKAQRSWEVTAVNEMLTQMESYDGLFIASTNLMDDLDEAALRRFDLKVNFKALRGEQTRTLLRAHLRELGLKDPKQAAEQRIASLHNLTPGDFAAVSRRARFKPLANAVEFAEALVGEVGLKRNGVGRPIGFVY